MFTKAERSSFPYWFAHWCAFQMTALNLKAWKFKYLFHDIEKPWLRLFLPYEKVQKLHRQWNAHHLPKKTDNKKRIDWEGMVIDWECSRFTKAEAPMTALETYNYFYENKKDVYDTKLMCENIPPILIKFKLVK